MTSKFIVSSCDLYASRNCWCWTDNQGVIFIQKKKAIYNKTYPADKGKSRYSDKEELIFFQNGVPD